MSYWRAVAAIVAKDLTVERRSKETLSAMLIFALMVVVIFDFAFDVRVEDPYQIAPGVLWVAIAFAGVLGFNRSFIMEREGGCIEGLVLTPVDRSAIYMGKFSGNILFMFIMEILILPVFAILFDVAVLNPSLWLIIALGTVGFTAVGTMFAAMAVTTRAREILLPILLFPIAVPVIVASTQATARILDQQALSDAYIWLRLLVAFDIISMVLALLGFEYVLEE
jgi:heme exporter protein B